MDDLPILPYNGSSEWSGSDTSRDRAISMDSSGETEQLQQQILDALRQKGKEGLTWIECDWVHPDTRHGSVSGKLTNLHEAGLIARLSLSRDGRKVYVLPEFVGDEETEEYRRNVTRTMLVNLLIDLKMCFFYNDPDSALQRINEELKEWIPKKKTN